MHVRTYIVHVLVYYRRRDAQTSYKRWQTSAIILIDFLFVFRFHLRLGVSVRFVIYLCVRQRQQVHVKIKNWEMKFKVFTIHPNISMNFYGILKKGIIYREWVIRYENTHESNEIISVCLESEFGCWMRAVNELQLKLGFNNIKLKHVNPILGGCSRLQSNHLSIQSICLIIQFSIWFSHTLTYFRSSKVQIKSKGFISGAQSTRAWI